MHRTEAKAATGTPLPLREKAAPHRHGYGVESNLGYSRGPVARFILWNMADVLLAPISRSPLEVESSESS